MAGPSIVQDVVGISGLQLSPFVSLAVTTTFADAGIRCNLNISAIPAGGSLLSLSSLLPDGGSSCENAYTQVAMDAGEKYVGTYSGSVRLLSGGDGGSYPVTCGSFSVTR